MRLRLSSHSVYKTQYHVCWIPRYRRCVLSPGVQEYLRKLFPKVLKQMPGVEIETVGMEVDHLHLVMVIPPRLSVSSAVGYIKQQTAKSLRKKFPWLRRVFKQKDVVWSVGYFVSTVGVDEEEIKQYVRWQGKKDSGQLQLELS